MPVGTQEIKRWKFSAPVKWLIVQTGEERLLFVWDRTPTAALGQSLAAVRRDVGFK